MYQRPANMKPAAMDQRDKVDLHDLIAFFDDAKERFLKEKDEEIAFVFEMMVDYFSQDYKSNKKLVFTGGAVGL